jgi:hypothetical protein
LANDDPHLKTVPQQIGVKRTKIAGLLLLLPFLFVRAIKKFNEEQLIVNGILVVTLSLF